MRALLFCAAALASGSLLVLGVACSKPEATCANAAAHVVNLQIKEAAGDERGALRDKKADLRTAWCEANASASKEQLTCVLGKQSTVAAADCLAAAPAAVAAGPTAAGGDSYGAGAAAVAPAVPEAEKPAPNPLTQLPAAPDAGVAGGKPLTADAIPQGDVRTFGQGDPARPPVEPPPPPDEELEPELRMPEAEQAPSKADCEALAKHFMSVYMGSEDMKQLDKKTRKQMEEVIEKSMQDLTEACRAGAFPAKFRACAMAAKKPDELQKCSM